MKCFLSTDLWLCSFVTMAQNDGWNITTTDTANYTGIVVANGRIGMLPSAQPFQVEHIILNNVYDKASPLGVSQILLGMNFGNLALAIDGEEVTADNVTQWQQTLHLQEAAFTLHLH